MTKRAILVLAALLAGCSVGPHYAGPPAVTPVGERFVRAGDPALNPAPGLARWWESLNDAALTGLVDDALAHNPDIDRAQARIREAQAQLTQARASQLPNASANATYLHAEIPGGTLGGSSGGGGTSSLDFENLGATASWEPDLFGGLASGVAQSRATIGARFDDLADAQVSLSAQVATAYVDLGDVQARIVLNRQSTDLQRQQLGLARQRQNAGTASSLDVERLQGQLESSEAQAIPLAAQRDGYLNQLAILTGRAPGALDGQLAPPAPVPLPPASVAIGDPAALIASRPDIRSAERQLAAATAGVGVKKAQQLPGIRFLGLLGLGGTKPGNIFDLGNLTALAAPMLQWSFLDFGKARAATAQAEAQRDQAEAGYRKAVLGALEDAETSLSRFGNLRQQLASLARAQASADRAASLNAQRVKAGTSATIDQLDIERQQLGAAIQLAQGKAQLTAAYIAVQKALGLGWVPALGSAGGKPAHHDR